jgi:hypothetical protein
MPEYTIIRFYKVPGESKQHATDRMLQAVALDMEFEYHLKDTIREPDEKTGEGKPINLDNRGWDELLMEQLGLHARWQKKK